MWPGPWRAALGLWRPLFSASVQLVCSFTNDCSLGGPGSLLHWPSRVFIRLPAHCPVEILGFILLLLASSLCLGQGRGGGRVLGIAVPINLCPCLLTPSKVFFLWASGCSCLWRTFCICLGCLWAVSRSSSSLAVRMAYSSSSILYTKLWNSTFSSPASSWIFIIYTTAPSKAQS